MHIFFVGRGQLRGTEKEVNNRLQVTDDDLVEAAKLIGRLEEVANRFESAAKKLLPAIEHRIEERRNNYAK